MIKSKFKIKVEFCGDTPVYSGMLDAFKNCGIPICNAYERYDGITEYTTYIDKEKQFAVESMARLLVLLPYAIINLLEDCHIRPFVTVLIQTFDQANGVRQVRLFTINEDYQIDYALDTKPRLN